VTNNNNNNNNKAIRGILHRVASAIIPIMPIIRNPFRRAVEPVIPENALSNATQPCLSRKSSEHKSTDLKTEPVEYKLSGMSHVRASGGFKPMEY